MPRQQEDIRAGVGISPLDILEEDKFKVGDFVRIYVHSWMLTKPTLTPFPAPRYLQLTPGEAENNLRWGNTVFYHPLWSRFSCELLYANRDHNKIYEIRYIYVNGLWVVPTPKK